jgi:hypothetical protein
MITVSDAESRLGPFSSPPRQPQDFFLGDVVRLKKPHPCGSHDWTVVRLGADIGLRCHGCGRRVLLPRRELERRLKSFVERGPGYDAARAILDEQINTPTDHESRHVH